MPKKEKTYPLALELKDAAEVNIWEHEMDLPRYYTFVKINNKDLWCFKRKANINLRGEKSEGKKNSVKEPGTNKENQL